MSVIEFEHVSKVYRLGVSQTSLRETAANLARRALNPLKNTEDERAFYALNDVSFSADQGDVLGFIGHNGAGKSTLLKLLSKVTFPTSGRISTRGRLAALIELGAGFHPELTGRENVFLNGNILGLKRAEIRSLFSKIIEFAELEMFIDTPIKRYSSGMYVRLAFAVAAHVRADILLVDEVLSVGDAAFQQKCLMKMEELRDSGVTILFVSHNLWSVSIFCRRAILLQRGKMVAEGRPDEVIDIYRNQDRQALLSKTDSSSGERNALSETASNSWFGEVDILDQNRQPTGELEPDQPFVVRCRYQLLNSVHVPMMVIRIRRSDGLLVGALPNPRTITEDVRTGNTFEARIDPLYLLPDYYTVQVLIAERDQPLVYATSISQDFRVKGMISGGNENGIFDPRVEWDAHFQSDGNLPA